MMARRSDRNEQRSSRQDPQSPHHRARSGRVRDGSILSSSEDSHRSGLAMGSASDPHFLVSIAFISIVSASTPSATATALSDIALSATTTSATITSATTTSGTTTSGTTTSGTTTSGTTTSGTTTSASTPSTRIPLLLPRTTTRTSSTRCCSI